MAPSTSRTTTAAAATSSRRTRQYHHPRNEYYYENVDPQQHQQSHQQNRPHRRSSSTTSTKPHGKKSNSGGGGANTGIERSYETVTKAIITAASSFGASSSKSTTTAAASAAYTNNIKSTGASNTTTRTKIAHSNNNNNNISSSATTHHIHNRTTTSGTARESTGTQATASSIGASLLYATSSMSYDEFEKLRTESLMLREEHEKRVSNAGLLFVANETNNKNKHHSAAMTTTATVNMPRSEAGNIVGSSTPFYPGGEEEEVVETATMNGRKSSIGTLSSSGMHSSNHHHLGHSHHYNYNNNNNHPHGAGGMVKLTSEGLSKIRDILHIGSFGSSKNDDVMSFYCSDDKTGKVMRQRISLANNTILPHPPGGGGADRGGGGVGSSEEQNVGRRRISSNNNHSAMPQSPTTHNNNYHQQQQQQHGHDENDNTDDKHNPLLRQYFVTPMISAATKTADHALPLLEAATKTAVRATMDGVDVAARTVAKVAVQSVEGVGMLAKDLANAKTPARSNVTTNHGNHHREHVVTTMDEMGRYADYVYDPDYKVVRTPPNHPTDAAAAGGGDAAALLPANAAGGKTPAVLAGAIAAAKCDLSPSDPNSLEFHEGGIPRVLVVHDDWEERAGFVRSTEEAMLLAGEGVVVGTKRQIMENEKEGLQHYAIEAKSNVPRGNRRISNPVDVDEETATMNGEEVDVDVMAKLRLGNENVVVGVVNDALSGVSRDQGRDGPYTNDEPDDDDDDAFDQTRRVYHAGRSHANEQVVTEEHEIGGGDGCGSDYDDPRNASMWVAVPENYMEEDAPDDYLDTTILRARDILRMGGGGSIKQDDIVEEEDDEEDCYERVMNADDVNMGELLLEDEDGDFSPTSVGNHTFFVGNVHIGFESEATSNVMKSDSPASFVGNVHVGFDSDLEKLTTTRNNAKEGNNDHRVWVEDAKSWTANSNDERSTVTAGGTRIEDLNVCQSEAGQLQVPTTHDTSDSIVNGEDSMTYLANALAAAVIKDKHRKEEFQAPYSMRKDELESMNSNRQVMFDLRGQRDDNGVGVNYAGLYLNPSESTDLSHSPPVRIVEGSDSRELRINPSESTDLSLFSNWAGEPAKRDDEVARALSVGNESGKRQLKGRIILVRIKKKLSKVAKKMLFIKWGKKGGVGIGATPASIMVNIPSPATDYPDPISPSAESIGASVTSSIMPGVGCAKRIIGAVPPKVGSPMHAQKYLYGTIHYGHRSSEDSTVDGGDSLPPPPKCIPHHDMKASAGNKDEFSYLAEAMMRGRCIDDEDSLLLYVTPKVDGTGEEVQFIRSMDGTPVPFREIIDEGVAAKEDEGIATASEVKPNNLSCLFTNEKGNTSPMTTMEIMDAVEVNGQIVLSPHVVNNNVAHVFRRSYPEEPKANILPGSVIDSECDDSDTLCYHDGCTVIHQASTFGDATIDTNPSTRPQKGKTATPATNTMGTIGTPILSPDGPPLTWQAKKNGSFLFSPNNMGRADPIIRAKERASLKDNKPSITMLPSAKSVKSTVPSGENKLLTIKQRYSNSSIESKNAENQPTDMKPMSSSGESDNEVIAIKSRVTADNSATTMASDHQAEFQVILNEFQDILNTFSSEGSTNEDEPSTATVIAPTMAEDEMNTPVVVNASKTKYKKTPYPASDVASDDDDRRLSSPLVVALNTTSSSSTSASKSISAEKTIPKSALKARKGLVKDRVYDIQHRMMATTPSFSPTNGAVTDVNGRLKRNHSYRSKKTRRMTNGDGVLAPRKAVLQTTYIRSVPIGIAKSYSRDSREEKDSQNELGGASYAAKYSMEVSKSIGNSHDDRINVGGGSSRFSDASSHASETTDCDPFNTLLGKMSSSSEDEEHSCSGVSHEDKENNADASSSNNSEPSPAARLLPFKSTTFVRPTEIHQLSPVLMPMKARSWRELAVKAAAAEKSKGNTTGNSSRFRSEKSWKEVSRM
jgi:hypothetical protein